MSTHGTDMTHQQELLQTTRMTLSHYLKQQAQYGVAYPAEVFHNILFARGNIQRIKENLRAQGVHVEDQPDDSEITPELVETATDIANTLRPYYMNDEKIDHWFAQEYVGLNRSTKALVNEVAAVTGAKQSTIVRFSILKEQWKRENKLLGLSKTKVEDYSNPHVVIFYRGSYHFAEDIAELMPLLTTGQARVIEKQHLFEQKAEKERHFLFLIESPVLSISIISERFITHVGFRYLPHYSSEKSNTTFIGATIGIKENILFLDPITIGQDI